MEDVIYNTPKTEVLRKFKRDINAILFDVDGTLIDVSFNLPCLDFPSSWQVMEKAAGFDKNEEKQKYFKEWLELSKTPENPKLKEVNEKLNSFWKGKHKDEVSKYLYPIPFLEGVRFFFDELKKAKGRWLTGIISRAPDFYVKEIADMFKINYYEACEVGLDEHNFLTGKFKSNGLYGKEKSLENFCKKFSIAPRQVAYHGDSKPDVQALRICGLGIAVNPHKKFMQEVIEASDVVLNLWYKHPLLEIL